MADAIKTKIKIDGEKEFHAAIKQINKDYKELASETKAVMSAFIGNEKSVDALTAANQRLGYESDNLDSKIAELENQLQKYAEAGLEGSSAAQALRIQLNNTTAEFNKHQAQIKQNEEEIQKLTEAENKNAEQTDDLTQAQASFGEGAGGVSGILKALGVDVSGLTRNLGLSRDQTNLMSEALNGGGLSLAAAGVAAAGGIALVAAATKEVIGFLTDAVSAASDYADSVTTLSTNFHIATDTLQEYQYMAELTDTSIDTITGSISKLTRSMDKARDGNQEVDAAFAALNIRVTDTSGQLRDANEVFLEAIDGLGRIHNETERDNIAMTLFGRSAMDLNSLIAQGSQGINAFAEEARAMGYVLSEEQIDALNKLDDQWVRFDNEMTTVKNQIAAEMAPALLELTQQLLDVAQTVDWREFGKNAGDAIRELTPLIVDMANALAGAAEALAYLLSLAGQGYSSNKGGMYGKDSYVNSTRTNNTSAASGASQQISQQPIVVNSTIKLDNQTLGHAVTPVVNARNAQRGNAF